MKYTVDDIYKAKKFKDYSLLVSRHYDSTIISSYGMRYQGRFYRENVSDTFLLNYRVNNLTPEFANSIANFQSQNARSAMRTIILEETKENCIELPEPQKVKGSFSTCLESRHSVREYENMDLSLSRLSTLLYTALGIKGEGTDTRIYPRAYASGGGLYPVYLGFYANRVQGLEKGFYRYQPHAHNLVCLSTKETALETLSNVTGIDVDNCSMMGFWIYERRKNEMKYGDLGTILAIHEAGLAMQTLSLTGCLLGIGFCELGGYHKMIAERELKIDGLDTMVIGCFVAGNEP